MRFRRFAIVAITLAVGVGALWWWNDVDDPDANPEPVDITAALNTALVTRSNVADTEELEAQLSFEDELILAHRVDPVPVVVTSTVGSGRLARTVSTTIEEPGERAMTALPSLGDVLGPGDVLYETDSTPVYLAPGSVAAWRTMDDETSGRDVIQLEQWLNDLGHGDADLTIDGEWSDATSRAVEAWQEATGQDVTGEVELGDLWFVPGAIRVIERHVTEGVVVADGAPILTVTSTNRTVHVSTERIPDGLLDTNDLRVRLPDRTELPASIRSVRGSTTGFEILVDADIDPDSLTAIDDLEVTLVWTVDELVDALTVPPEAIRRLDDGRYVVEVLEGDVVRTVTVEVLGQAGRVVAVNGVDEAARVLLP